MYASGVRTKGSRIKEPRRITKVEELLPYLPAQLELGGGASLELGIPPLNYLHTVYGLFNQTDQFAFGDDDFFWQQILPHPRQFYATQTLLPYQRALTAKVDGFYSQIRSLSDAGYIQGPVITNNFDGLCSLVGLEELYVRRYDESRIVPDISFAPHAKSLLVIGSHADRRRIQQAARQQGLHVIYVDPETYKDHAGQIIQYPLEDLYDGDILVPLTASLFTSRLCAALDI